MSSHYCRGDARGGLFVRALCGVLIRRTTHVNEPTCATCAAVLQVDADQLAPLQAATFDPDQVVKHEPFDPCVGYRPRRTP